MGFPTIILISQIFCQLLQVSSWNYFPKLVFVISHFRDLSKSSYVLTVNIEFDFIFSPEELNIRSIFIIVAA